jgi:hypothetical protein
MVQLNILSGAKAGGSQAVRRFPFHVGRAADNDLCLDAAGVWDHHFVLNLRRKEGVVLETVDQAFAAVNDQSQTSIRLRNGDFISFGSVKVRFWLAAPRQRGLLLREWSAWLILILVTLGQVALIAWLLGLG